MYSVRKFDLVPSSIKIIPLFTQIVLRQLKCVYVCAHVYINACCKYCLCVYAYIYTYISV